jgi:hypothetical protein
VEAKKASICVSITFSQEQKHGLSCGSLDQSLPGRILMEKTKDVVFTIIAIVVCFALLKFVVDSDPVHSAKVLREFI